MLVYNADLVNVAYVGYRPDLGTTNASPVQPLGYTVMDGTRQLYGICPGGSAVLNVTPGGISQSASPAQIAAQINAIGLAKDSTLQTTNVNTNNVHTDLALGTNNFLGGSAAGALISAVGLSVAKDMLHANAAVTTEIAALLASGTIAGTPGGIPLLVFQNNLDKLTNRVIAHGAQYQSASFSINQPGFDFVLNVTIPAGNTTPDLQVDLIWTDTTTGVATLTTDRFYFPATQNGSNSFGGYGKTKGNQLQVVMTNQDTAQSMTVNYGISQNSRIPARDDIRSVAFNGRGATATVDQDPNSLALILVQTNVAANSSNSFALPFYSGRCKVISGPQAAAYRYQITAPAYGDAGVLATAQTIVYDTNTLAATASVSDYFQAPRAGMVVRIFNNSAGVANINCSILAEI